MNIPKHEPLPAIDWLDSAISNLSMTHPVPELARIAELQLLAAGDSDLNGASTLESYEPELVTELAADNLQEQPANAELQSFAALDCLQGFDPIFGAHLEPDCLPGLRPRAHWLSTDTVSSLSYCNFSGSDEESASRTLPGILPFPCFEADHGAVPESDSEHSQ